MKLVGRHILTDGPRPNPTNNHTRKATSDVSPMLPCFSYVMKPNANPLLRLIVVLFTPQVKWSIFHQLDAQTVKSPSWVVPRSLPPIGSGFHHSHEFFVTYKPVLHFVGIDISWIDILRFTRQPKHKKRNQVNLHLVCIYFLKDVIRNICTIICSIFY